MGITFSCSYCNEIIVVNFLVPGEISVCKNCKHKNIVPQQSDENVQGRKDTTLFGAESWDKQFILPKQPNIKTDQRSLEYGLRRIVIGVIFLLINITLNLGPVLFQTALIGNIFILVGLLEIKKLKKFNKLIIPIMVFSILHIISGVLALVGLAELFFFNFHIVEILLICLLYYFIVRKVEILKEFRGPILIVLVIQLLDAAFFILYIVSLPIVIKVTEYLSSLPVFNSFTALLGAMLPVLILQTISMLTMLYISISLLNFIKKQNPDSIVFDK